MSRHRNIIKQIASEIHINIEGLTNKAARKKLKRFLRKAQNTAERGITHERDHTNDM